MSIAGDFLNNMDVGDIYHDPLDNSLQIDNYGDPKTMLELLKQYGVCGRIQGVTRCHHPKVVYLDAATRAAFLSADGTDARMETCVLLQSLVEFRTCDVAPQ